MKRAIENPYFVSIAWFLVVGTLAFAIAG